MKIKQAEISALTEKCIEDLKKTEINHFSAIHYWIWQIYQIHGYNLHVAGGHFMDYLAQEQANNLLNSYLINEVLKLIPYSTVASNLRKQAMKTNKPLATPFEGLEVKLNKSNI